MATVLFTSGCNLHCPFCHNWRLVLEPKGPFLSDNIVLEFVQSRKQFVDAVVITGGEPTLQKDTPIFLEKLKRNGFVVKLDTNGFFPDMLEKSLPYLDYVALDIKTCPDRYHLLGESDIGKWLRTIEILKAGSIEYEFRCTAVPGFVDKQSVHQMGELVKGAKRFIFQQFVPGDTLDKKYNDTKPYSVEIIKGFADIMRHYVVETTLRI
jgi:pyruvate formate lyase activating enzyme